MDASTIRLILIVVGALLILLLYLWERHRERREEIGDGRADDVDEELDAPNRARSGVHEPNLGAYGDEDDYDDAEEEIRPATPGTSFWSRPRQDVEEAFDDAMDVDSEDAPEQSHQPIMDKSRPDPLLIQVSVSARRYPFRGSDVVEVAERCGLHPGDMDIFHCLDEFDDDTRIYFSMANMVKPGTFPFETMDDFLDTRPHAVRPARGRSRGHDHPR